MQSDNNRKVAVVYYLCRNRQLDHPHFMEVPLSSPKGLFLKDVIARLGVLRGPRVASMYSWSCKRSYKNGYVWHDLCEDDLILPAQGEEYVLKGSELFDESNSDPATAVPATSISKNSELKSSDIPEVRADKVQMNPSSGGLSVPNTSVTAPPPTNRESNTSELGSSVSHSTVNLHGSPFGSASKSVVFNAGTVSQGASLPVVPSTSSTGTVSQGTPALSVPMASSTLFNINGNAGGSSLSNPQVVNPSYTFGHGSSASSSDTTTVTPGSGPTASVFRFGASPISEGNAVSSSSASTPAIFSFGFGSGAGSSSSSTSSSATLPKFSFGGKSVVPDASGSTGAPGIFNFGGSSSTSSAVNTISSNTAANVFGSSWQSPTTSIFGSSSTSSPSSGFSIGASSMPSAVANTAPMLFNSSSGASSSSFFSFTTASAPVSSSQPLPPNQPVFGAPPSNTFGLSSWNNNQANAEDSMAEDPVQLSAPSAPVFGQPTVSPSPPGFTFGGSTIPSQPNPFMFGNQQNQAVPQNPSPSPSPFQASGSLEFNAGGSFLLASGGGSGRKITKISRNKNRKR